jgi:hypothetical protein
MILLIAEIFSLLSSLALIMGSLQKTHKHIIIFSMTESILVIISESLFGATAGIITTVVLLIIDFLNFIDKDRKSFTIILMISLAVLGILNMEIWFDLLPMIASIVYTWLITYKNKLITKTGLLFNTTLWLIYNTYIGSVVYTIMDTIVIILCITEIIKIIIKDKRAKKNQVVQ